MKIFLPALTAFSFAVISAALAADAPLKIGIVGLDTSHVGQFAKLLNVPGEKEHVDGARIVVGFPGGSPDVEHSWSRVEQFTREAHEKYGVAIVKSIAEVAAQSDAIMILSVDGRPHLAQAREVFKVGKPVFIDKPLAGSLRDAIAISRLAAQLKVPLFSASSLRYAPGIVKLQGEKLGKVRGAVSYGPAHLEPHHPDLYWYGIHPTEALYTILGMGCESVVRTHTEDTDVITGVWSGGRTGVVIGLRNGKLPYRVTVFGADAVRDQEEGREYSSLLREIVHFFQTKQAPVRIEETLEIMTFMEAADESKRQGGAPVLLKDVWAKNQPAAD